MSSAVAPENPSLPRREVTLATSVGFGATDFMGGGALALVSAYLLFFLTTFCNLSPLEAGSILGLSRIVDSVMSIFMGSLSDNLYKTRVGRRFGRRRFFLLIGSPLILVYSCLWFSGMSYWYYLVTYIVVDSLVSFIQIPYETLPTEMTTDFGKRTLMSTARLFWSALATTGGTMLGAFLISRMGQKNPMAYTVLGAIFAVIFSICVFVSYKCTWERPIPAEMLVDRGRESSGVLATVWSSVANAVKDYVKTLRIRAFRQHLLLYLLGVTGQDVFTILWAYYMVFCLHLTASFASVLLSLSIIVLICTPLWGWMFVRLGARSMYLLGFIPVLAAVTGFYVLYRQQPNHGTTVVALYVLMSIYEFGKGLCFFIPWQVFPQIPDLGRLMYREVREGSFASVMVFLRKSTAGIASMVVGAILAPTGFVSGIKTPSQPPSAQRAIALILWIGVGGLMVLASIVAIRFRMNRETQHVVAAELERLLDGGSKDDVPPETRRVCEMLTGVSYERLWPRIDSLDAADATPTTV